ncbi:glycoside hydrolase family 43 protein [Lentisphaera profundi]|uniref:Glycoside hydrolase family 43 protein n=1 Tax=Lentisphaera profundi TaxID=1658616 RepID=A0ABY7VMN8_9BACT|nr:glycoside hydrolase family 43 protein [Lentisphaera profundi]WDE95286.1 glycoside hydrolase family 43 protein [Lentisphaera profundi]
MKLNNTSLSHIRGFNYQPSFAGHGIPRWLDRFNAATIEEELRRGIDYFPWYNTTRIWLSIDAWWDNRELFLRNLQKEIEINRKLGLKVIPVLFNGCPGIPVFGFFTSTDADRILKCKHPDEGGHNLRVLYLDYVKDIAELYAKDDIIAAWDLCNEPGLEYKEEGNFVREAIFLLLEKSAEELRTHGVQAPIGVGNFGPVRDDERVLDFVDCIMTHRYYVPHCMTLEKFRENVKQTVDFCNEHNLPWCVTECSWGAWDDEERAKNIPGLSVFLEVGAGIVPYILSESPCMDAHGKEAGVHYGWGAPEDLCFIRRDGQLRKGHEVINDVVAQYPIENNPFETSADANAPYDSFRPGKVWNDVDGKPIQAHGGGVIKIEDTYYWYGENKDAETTVNSLGTARTPLTGVSCYSSKDLYNWKYEGLALEGVNEEGHELHPRNVLERPKVLYNDATSKYVMWFHLDAEDYSWAKGGVAISDSPTGPFEYLGSMQPNDSMLRDMTLFKDDDGKGYLIYTSENNSTMHISLLDESFTKPVGEPNRILINMVREAPAIFKKNGYYYLFTSACTGWNDNRAWLTTAEDLMGDWFTLRGGECLKGNPEHQATTFESQSTFALVVQNEEKEDQFIFMSDRWNQDDLGDSRYLWLPVEFDEKNNRFAHVVYHDEWKLNK